MSDLRSEAIAAGKAARFPSPWELADLLLAWHARGVMAGREEARAEAVKFCEERVRHFQNIGDHLTSQGQSAYHEAQCTLAWMRSPSSLPAPEGSER